MLRMQNHMGYVNRRLAFPRALELLPQLKEAILDLILYVRVKFLLTAYQLRFLVWRGSLEIWLLLNHRRTGV
jgi:hypothetical protein